MLWKDDCYISALRSRLFEFRFQLLMSAKPFTENLRDANEAGISLLITDAGMALTLLDAAEVSSDQETRSRRIGEARKAHDVILHLLSNLAPDATQYQELSERMSLLRKRLGDLGAFGDSSQPL